MLSDRDVDTTLARLWDGPQTVHVLIGPDDAAVQTLAPAPGTVTLIIGPGSTRDEFLEGMRRAHELLRRALRPTIAFAVGADATQAEYVNGLRWIRALASGERFVPFDAVGASPPAGMVDVPHIPGSWQTFIGPASVAEDPS